MISIKPFKGIHPVPVFARDISCPPYDVLSTEEARIWVADNPISFLRVNKPELEFIDNPAPSSQKIFTQGKKNLRHLIQNGYLIQDETEHYYLYRITQGNRSQTGLAVLLSLDDYQNGGIRKHENTGSETVTDRTDHMDILNAQVGPVLSAFRHSVQIQRLFEQATSAEPYIRFTADDNTMHEIWMVNSVDDIREFTRRFSTIDSVYIADGHHRSHAAWELCKRRRELDPEYDGHEPYNYFLNILFPDDQLNIISYNRLVEGLNGHTIDSLIELIRHKFSVQEVNKPFHPVQPHIFGMYCQGQWYRLGLSAKYMDDNDPEKCVDAGLLYEHIFSPILGLLTPKGDPRLTFVGGDKSPARLQSMVDAGIYDLAFTLFPVTMDQVMAVSDAGKIMPAKSTWFDPKLRSGLVVYPLD